MGWDLTYQRLIRDMRIAPRNFLTVWAQRTRDLFPERLVLQFEDEPLISAFLVEHAIDGHAGDPIGLWAGRTINRAFVQIFTLGSRNKQPEAPRAVDAAKFDDVARVLTQWKTTPLAIAPRGVRPESKDVVRYGYVGVVSVSFDGRSRQWPIALADLYNFSQSSPDLDVQLGGLNKVLQPLLPSPETTSTPSEQALERERVRNLLSSTIATAFLSSTLEDTSGASQPMSVYRGELLVVSFFATWCPSCDEWSRRLSAIQEEFREKGVVVIAVVEEAADRIIFFQAKHSPKHLLLRATSSEHSLFRDSQVTAIPTSYVIDKAGAAHGPHVGAFAAPDLEALLGRLSP